MTEPLAQFQHTLTTREEILKLTLTLAGIARNHSEFGLSDDDIRSLFEVTWPGLESKIETARAMQISHSQPARNLEDKVDEILTKVRQLTSTREAGVWFPQLFTATQATGSGASAASILAATVPDVYADLDERIAALRATDSKVADDPST